MLKYLVFSLVVAAASALPYDLDEEDIHSIVKDSVKHIDESIRLHDVYDKQFYYDILFLRKRGILDLSNGWLKYLNTYGVQRKIRQISETRFDIPLIFSKLQFSFDFEASITLFSNYGILNGNLDNFELVLPVEIKNDIFVLYRKPDFVINDIKIKFSDGSIIKTFLYNVLSSTFEGIVRQIIHDKYAYQVAQRIVNEMNISSQFI